MFNYKEIYISSLHHYLVRDTDSRKVMTSNIIELLFYFYKDKGHLTVTYLKNVL